MNLERKNFDIQEKVWINLVEIQNSIIQTQNGFKSLIMHGIRNKMSSLETIKSIRELSSLNNFTIISINTLKNYTQHLMELNKTNALFLDRKNEQSALSDLLESVKENINEMNSITGGSEIRIANLIDNTIKSMKDINPSMAS